MAFRTEFWYVIAIVVAPLVQRVFPDSVSLADQPSFRGCDGGCICGCGHRWTRGCGHRCGCTWCIFSGGGRIIGCGYSIIWIGGGSVWWLGGCAVCIKLVLSVDYYCCAQKMNCLLFGVKLGSIMGNFDIRASSERFLRSAAYGTTAIFARAPRIGSIVSPLKKGDQRVTLFFDQLLVLPEEHTESKRVDLVTLTERWKSAMQAKAVRIFQSY